MPLDAICLRAVTNELNNVLAGCRVEKVYQPDRDEIVLQTRGGQGGPRRLLLSIAAGAPRVHFIDAARENPAAPPMFCMLLRKHVQGAKIAAVSQPAVERMLTIELDTTDEMGVPCKKHLICELMGKQIEAKYCPSSHYWAKYPELYGGAYGIKPEILDHEVNKYSLCDNTHAKECYGWEPKIDIREGLRRVIENECAMLAARDAKGE